MLNKQIPKKLRNEMERDPYYQRCCVTGRLAVIEKVEWHHNFQWEGQRLNEKWAILPIAKYVHDQARTKKVKDYLDYIMLNRASESTLKKYSKGENLIEKRDRLNKYYDNEKNIPLL